MNSLILFTAFVFMSFLAQKINSSIFDTVVNLDDLIQSNGTEGYDISGESFKDYLGSSIHSAGDFNGDGISDFIIGAFGYTQESFTGASFVIFGNPTGSYTRIDSSNFNSVVGIAIVGENIGDSSGYSVGGGCDINNDGFSDVIIGAYTAGTLSTGKVYVVFGNSSVGTDGEFYLSSLNGDNGFAMSGESPTDFFGRSVCCIPDINGDSFPEILIGADGNNETGAAYVIFGKPSVGTTGSVDISSLNGDNGFKMIGRRAGDYFGYSVAGAGDVNNDGFQDIVIGAPYEDQYQDGVIANVDVGFIYVVYGGTNLGGNGTILVSNIIGWSVNGGNANQNFGLVVSSGCDIDGDDYDDVLVGDVSSLSLLNGGITDLVGSIQSLLSSTGNFQLEIGTAVTAISCVEDINDDGYPDIAVSSNTIPNTQDSSDTKTNAGAVFVIFGGPLIATGSLGLSTLYQIGGFQVYGASAGDGLGSSVGGNGDFNGDGYSDLLIGAPGASMGAGKAYVLFGRTDGSLEHMNPTPEVAWRPLLGPNTLDSPMGFARIDGFLYATGFTRSFANGTRNENDFDAFVYKRLGTGDYERMWKVHLGGEGNDVGLGVTADRLFNVYVTGKAASAQPRCTHSGGSDVFVAKLNAEGQQQWLVQFGSSGDDEGRKVIVTEKEEEEEMTLTVYGTISGVAFKIEFDSDGRFK